MESNAFILALSKTLPESCLQGIIVYLVLQLLFLGYKRSTPLLKFNLFFAANLFLFVGFAITFFHHYHQISDTSFNSHLSSNKIGNNVSAINIKLNLWFQLSFWISNYASLITGCYLLGLFFCMLRLAIGLLSISWFKNNRHLILDNHLSQISIQLSTNFRLIKTASVYLSDKISVPLTIGFIKPMIVFPIALINKLSTEQTEAILLHELAHVKRNDYLLNILLSIIQSFLFFNPAVWLMKREINKYREQCCDDLVLDNTSHKIAYARALLLIEETRSTQLTLALASNGKKYNLLNRIKRITNMKTNEPLPQNKLVVLLLAFILIGLTVAWHMPVKKALKKLPPQHFKAIKADSDSDKITVVSDKIEKRAYNKPGKLTLSGKRITFDASADTIIKSEGKIKIVLEDSLGNKKEYNSIKELPAEAQKDFFKQNQNLDQLRSPNFSNWKLDTNEIASIKKYFNSPEWKNEMAAIRKQSENIRKQFNSPEWKKQMADIKKQSLEIRKQFDSPEWKKQMADIRKQSENISKQFNSPEWKKQMEDLRKMAIDSARKNWKKSSNEERKFAIPEKVGEPKEL